MADHAPNIFPTMRFVDADAALEWLSRTLGFEERTVSRNDEGIVRHVEMSLGPGVIMFGQGDPAEQGVYVAVENADAQYERARAAGAEIVRKIVDTPYGSREFSVRDLDGHMWSFGTYRPEAVA
ncbi:MAG: VOC family protein [Gaiellaceae bacterium]